MEDGAARCSGVEMVTTDEHQETQRHKQHEPGEATDGANIITCALDKHFDGEGEIMLCFIDQATKAIDVNI